MDPAIIAALITGAVTVLVVMITNSYQNRRIVQLMEIKLALIIGARQQTQQPD